MAEPYRTPTWTPTEAALRAIAERWGHAHRSSEGCPGTRGFRVIPEEWDQDAKAIKDVLIEARHVVTTLRSTLQELREREEGPYSFMDSARAIRDAEGLMTAALVLLYPEVAKWRATERERACVDVLFPRGVPPSQDAPCYTPASASVPSAPSRNSGETS